MAPNVGADGAEWEAAANQAPINLVQTDFYFLVETLKEYRSYLPSSCLQLDGTMLDASDWASHSSLRSPLGSIRATHKDKDDGNLGAAAGSARHSRCQSYHSSKSGSTVQAALEPSQVRRVGSMCIMTVNKRTVTCLSLNVRGLLQGLVLLLPLSVS